MDNQTRFLQSRIQANTARRQEETTEQAPGSFPLDEEFGYSVKTHSWQRNGQPLTNEEAAPIYREKMASRRVRQQAEDEEFSEARDGTEMDRDTEKDQKEQKRKQAEGAYLCR